jgi:hypothetical protein
MGYHDGYNEISGRPLDAGDMISDEGDGVPHALKELTKVHRPDLVDYLPEFWRKFNALSEPAEDPNQERIDLNKNDIDIIQIMASFYRENSDPMGSKTLHQAMRSISTQNLASDALVCILIILHIMEIIGWPHK